MNRSFWLGNPWFVKSIIGFAEPGYFGFGNYKKHNFKKTNDRMKKWLSK
jgi:hypothetical protein